MGWERRPPHTEPLSPLAGLVICLTALLPTGNGAGKAAGTLVFQPDRSVWLWMSRGPSLGLRNTEYHCLAVNGSSYLHLAKNYTCAHNMVPKNEANGSL